ncbi:MAG TPA: glycosyltransferase [Verrucomicrobiae bacterium]|jgi:glycosyltransferase involved in cell wall biosynthesis|nr:glycosyltransferase [Verrucomicrobiae bacterium]
MKKALHLTTHLNSGGITIYILRLVEALRKNGWDTALASSGGEYVPLFLEKKCVFHELNIKTKSELSPKLVFALPRLVKILREEKYDLIHAHTRVAQVLAACASVLSGVPVVTTCHGFYKRRLGRILFPAWGSRAIAISEPVGKSLAQGFGVPREKIRIVNNGVDVELLDEQYQKLNAAEAKKSFGLDPRDKVVGIVARLVNDKGHEYLIRAAQSLLGRIPDVRLLIVGDGRERMPLERLAVSLDLQKNVHFTGNLTDVPRALAAMDIFAFPATWREGFGLSIVEAMACAKPVIVTNIWALNSLIEDRKTGILVEPKRVDVLAGAIEMLFHDNDLRKAIGEAARRIVIENFNIPRMAREISDVYNEVLTERRKSL